MYISLSGLDKAAVLAALYNAGNAKHRVGRSTERMSVDEAQSLLDSGQTCFGLIRGRPMHIDLSGYTLWTADYDAVNFPGAAAKAIEPLLAEDSRTGDGELGRLAQEFSRASQLVSELDKDAGRLDRRIDSLSSRVSALESKVDHTASRLSALEDGLGDICSTFTDHRHGLEGAGNLRPICGMRCPTPTIG